jgi:hypothetical protein
MNKDSMGNDAIIVEHSLGEQQPYIGNQQHGILIENQLNLERCINVTSKLKKQPMTPTPLYIYIFFAIIKIYIMFCLENILVGQDTEPQQLWVHFLSSQS